jgi:hypothetical protein
VKTKVDVLSFIARYTKHDLDLTVLLAHIRTRNRKAVATRLALNALRIASFTTKLV